LIFVWTVIGKETLRAQELYKPLIVNSQDNFTLNNYLYHYEDKSNQADIISVRKRPFTLLKANGLNAGITPSNHWVYFQIKNNDSHPTTLFIEVDNPRINHLNIYEIRRDSLINQLLTGDALPFESRIFPNKTFIYPFTLQPNEEAGFYIMAEKRHETLTFKVNTWQAKVFEEQDRKAYLLWGALAGITLLVLAFNTVVWLATKDNIYGLFMVIILVNGFNIGAAAGLNFQYFWNNSPLFNSFYPQTFSSWMLIVLQLSFMQKFIGQTSANSRAFYFVRGFQYLISGTFIISVILLYFNVIPRQYFQLMLIFSLIFDFVAIPLAIFSIAERIRLREKIVIFFTIVTIFKTLVLLIYLANVALKFMHFDSLSVVLVDFLFDLIVLSIGVSYFGFSKFRQQNEDLLITLYQHEQVQSQRIIEALEIERNRIAEDLYDDVGAILSTAINYIASALRVAEIKERFPVLIEARRLLNTAIENLRTVSHNLMPKNFAELGLAKSLEETLNKLSNSEIRFNFVKIGTEVSLDVSTEIQIFRIASELINEVIKHAEATEATLQLVYQPEYLNLIVEDNGINESRFEMNNLSSKVGFVNGNIEIDKNKHGSTVIVEIPYEPRK